jgi:hypothetical protein
MNETPKWMIRRRGRAQAPVAESKNRFISISRAGDCSQLFLNTHNEHLLTGHRSAVCHPSLSLSAFDLWSRDSTSWPRYPLYYESKLDISALT